MLNKIEKEKSRENKFVGIFMITLSALVLLATIFWAIEMLIPILRFLAGIFQNFF